MCKSSRGDPVELPGRESPGTNGLTDPLTILRVVNGSTVSVLCVSFHRCFPSCLQSC